MSDTTFINGTTVVYANWAQDVNDHVYDKKSGSEHRTVTTLVNGFMSASDKVKLNGIASGATASPLSSNIPLINGTASAGSSPSASRSDHIHPTDTSRAPTSSPSFTNQAFFQGVRETITVVAASGSSYTINSTSASIIDITLTANCTFTFPAASSGGQFTLFLKQDATGSRTVVWPSTVRWANSVVPTLTTTASRTDVITFICDGTYWLGFVGNLNFTRA